MNHKEAIETAARSQTGDPLTDPTPFILTSPEIVAVVQVYLEALLLGSHAGMHEFEKWGEDCSPCFANALLADFGE